MNRSAMALAALAAGILVGAIARAADNIALLTFAHALQPLGTLWLNALKMTLVPLVFAMVAQGMISLDRRGGGGRLLGITLPLLVGLLGCAMTIGMGFGFVFDALWPVTPGALAGLSTAPVTVVPPAPTITQMIVGLVPTNPVAAASNGALASIVVFAIVFGFAVSRTTTPDDAPVERVIDGLATAMIRIVHWVLWFTPLGIFALSLGLALNTGLAIAGFLAQLVIVTVCAALIALVIGYLLAWLVGGVSPRRFGRAVIGPQAMAAGSCSSAATLPAMLDASERKLGIPPAIGGAVLPLAVSLFRFSVPLYQGAVIILLHKALAMPIAPATPMLGGAILVLTNLGVAGLPGAAIIYASWSAGLQVMGLPLEIIPLLIAVNALPDIFVTVANVTAHLAVTTIVARLLGRTDPVSSPGAVAVA